MISYVENNRLVHLTGDARHPYTKGKLCAKGYAYIEKNNHRERLKFPYYQEVKGSGKFKQITWRKAFDLIVSEMMNIHERYGNFLPLALYKGSGNVGVHHLVTDQLFSSIGETTRIVGSSKLSTGFEATQYSMGTVKMSDPSIIKEASMVIIWGANPAATNIHLIPFIIEAKVKGAKLVVIDPLYTQTAEHADLYIQLRPSTDGALANVLIKGLVEADVLDKEFLDAHSFGFDEYLELIKGVNQREYLLKCGVADEAIDLLLNWLKEAKAVSHIIGFGLQKHSNGGQNIRAIEALAAVHGDIGKKGGGVFLGHNDSGIFNNQQLFHSKHLFLKNRIVNMNDCHDRVLPAVHQPPVEMMWISCANPLTQEPNPQFITNYMKDIPFVVTVEQFMTPTAKMSNLVLPTTTHFEELDIVTSSWHKEIALNEKVIPPYYESRSEWNIMNELAIRLNEYSPDLCSFPVHSSEEEYLNSQFNEKVNDRYHIESVSDLRERFATANSSKIELADRQFATGTGKYQFYSSEAKQRGFLTFPLYTEGKSPTNAHPFWLITPHHPYALNSQFHFLDLSNEGEAYVGIHSKVAKELGIFNGEIVKVFNDQASIEIKAVYSAQVPKDILLIYQGWYPDSQVIVNQLVPVLQTDMGENTYGTKGIAFFDTFVNVTKLKSN